MTPAPIKITSVTFCTLFIITFLIPDICKKGVKTPA
jgi:hypothetical protein